MRSMAESGAPRYITPGQMTGGRYTTAPSRIVQPTVGIRGRGMGADVTEALAEYIQDNPGHEMGEYVTEGLGNCMGCAMGAHDEEKKSAMPGLLILGGVFGAWMLWLAVAKPARR